MANDAFDFTSDEEIAAFQPRDRGMELIGFVDAIDGLRTLKTSQGHVLKFVLNNASNSRIRVLIWGTRDARRYESEIRMNQVLHITNGCLQSANENFRNRNENISLLEFHVQTSSVITTLGEYGAGHVAPLLEQQYHPIEMDEVMIREGPVEIQNAYIKVPFTEIRTGNSTYGQGIVVDGHYRLTVQIGNFRGNSRMTRGVRLHIRGLMNKQPGGYFRVADEDAIDIIEDAGMSFQDLKSSIHSVLLVRTRRPRVPPENNENDPAVVNANN